MYYLLTSPFKCVKKSVNQWYILFKVLGKRFDDAMESVYNAREQTMVSTCNPYMLQVHAEDRNMERYPDESDENFRARIANYREVLILGGSDKGVSLAVRSLGYDNVEIRKANKMDNYNGEDRWAEFYVIINADVDESFKIDFNILKHDVRKVKYVTAKDNYRLQYQIEIFEKSYMNSKVKCFCDLGNFNNIYSSSVRNEVKVSVGMQNISVGSVRWRYINEINYLNGAWLLDGTVLLNSEEKSEYEN